MSARPWYRWGIVLSLLFACLVSTGCNPLTVFYFLFLLPPPKVDAAYAGLEKQKVAVLTFASRSAQFEHAGIDNDLAKGVARELREHVKHIKLVDANEVRQWRDEHSAFEPTDVGRKFEANRVVYIEVESFTLYEEHTTQLYRGKANVRVQVFDMTKDGDMVWETRVEPEFPGHRPIPVTDMSRDKFRSLFTKYLTRQIAHNFFDYKAEEDFTVN